MQIDIQTLLGIWAGITSGLSVWLTYRSNKYERETRALKSTLEQLKLFSERDARNFLMHARDLDHNSWDLGEKIKRFVQNMQTNNDELKTLCFDIVALAGSVRASSFENFKSMLRLYQLAGEPLSREKVQRWIEDGFIPEGYRTHVLPHANEK